MEMGVDQGVTDELRAAIQASGEPRSGLAKRSGVAESILSRLVNGKRGISMENAEKVAAALRMEIVLRPKKRPRKDQ